MDKPFLRSDVCLCRDSPLFTWREPALSAFVLGLVKFSGVLSPETKQHNTLVPAESDESRSIVSY